MNPKSEIRMGSARVARARSGVAPELSSTQSNRWAGEEKFVRRSFRRDAENHTPEAYAPQVTTERTAPSSEFGMKTNRGFTLIEIMMAMAIFALVLAAIYSTWTLIMRASRTGREVAAQVQRERVAVHTVKEALTSVQSYAADLKDYTFLVENGSEPMLSFSARLPESGFPRGGRWRDFVMRRVMFSLENGQDGERDLVMRQWPILMEMSEDEREHPLVLAHNVKEFVVETWDTKAGKEGDWSDTWKQTNQIPTKVKVTLVLNSPGQRGGFSERQEAIYRVIDLPSVTVQSTWQTPLLQRGPAGNPANPVNPVNPGNPGIPGRPGFPAGPGNPRVRLQ